MAASSSLSRFADIWCLVRHSLLFCALMLCAPLLPLAFYSPFPNICSLGPLTACFILYKFHCSRLLSCPSLLLFLFCCSFAFSLFHTLSFYLTQFLSFFLCFALSLSLFYTHSLSCSFPPFSVPSHNWHPGRMVGTGILFPPTLAALIIVDPARGNWKQQQKMGETPGLLQPCILTGKGWDNLAPIYLSIFRYDTPLSKL